MTNKSNNTFFKTGKSHDDADKGSICYLVDLIFDNGGPTQTPLQALRTTGHFELHR